MQLIYNNEIVSRMADVFQPREDKKHNYIPYDNPAGFVVHVTKLLKEDQFIVL